MPFLKTSVLVTECEAVTADIDGQSIGQLVDAALAKMLGELPPNGVPQGIEFGFDGPDDWHRFCQTNGESLHSTMSEHRRRKSRPA